MLIGNGYQIIDIKANSGHLTSQIPGETALDYYPLSKNKFIFKKDDYSSVYEFKGDKKGHINRIHSTDSGPIVCVKAADSSATSTSAKHKFYTTQRFYRGGYFKGQTIAIAILL